MAMLSQDFSEDQQSAVEQITDWYASGTGQLRVGGLGGTGKTFIARAIPQILGVPVAYCAPTGRAALMINRGNPDADAVTIHRMFYTPEEREVCRISEHKPGRDGRCPRCTETGIREPCQTEPRVSFSRREDPDIPEGTGLIIADEASMINEDMWDLLSGCGVPVLAFGDHGQLKPVGSEFSLMADPDIRLEHLHRAAEGSPVSQLAMHVRATGGVRPFARVNGPGGWAEKISYRDLMASGGISAVTSPGDMIITGTNPKRQAVNGEVRRRAGMPSWPAGGDWVVCLRNNYENGVMNGERGQVVAAGYPHCAGVLPIRHYAHVACPCDQRHGSHLACECMLVIPLSVVFEGGDGATWSGLALLAQFDSLADTQRRALFDSKGTYLRGRGLGPVLLLDYGYALTCHKAQGGQAERVLVLEERFPREDRDRWLYTAISRAERYVTVVGA